MQRLVQARPGQRWLRQEGTQVRGTGAGPAGTESSWQHQTVRACSPPCPWPWSWASTRFTAPFSTPGSGSPSQISDMPRLSSPGLSSLALLRCPSHDSPLLLLWSCSGITHVQKHIQREPTACPFSLSEHPQSQNSSSHQKSLRPSPVIRKTLSISTQSPRGGTVSLWLRAKDNLRETLRPSRITIHEEFVVAGTAVGGDVQAVSKSKRDPCSLSSLLLPIFILLAGGWR